jgi:hypothetical protein
MFELQKTAGASVALRGKLLNAWVAKTSFSFLRAHMIQNLTGTPFR